MILNDITWLHVEPTTRCNAWCSSCGRNNSGYGLSDEVVIGDLDLDRFKEVIDKLPNLTSVQLCGTMGDPCAGKLINEQLKIIKDRDLDVQIHTNGSLRTKDWWQKLAKLFGNRITVWFAIDGLEDTHSIYRQATNWKKIIENAKSFIDAGGNAIWQFIPFAHNEHQIQDCMKLSTEMGFSKFEFIKNASYNKKTLDYRSGKEIDIRPWSKHDDQWRRKSKRLDKVTGNKITRSKVEKKDCMHIELNSIYLSARGVISACCYIRPRPFKEGEIEHSFATKEYFPTCLKKCGT